MSQKKIAVVVNNRANYARIKSFLVRANLSKKIDLMLILASASLVEKFGNLEKIIKNDGLKIFKKIYTAIDGDLPVTMAKSTALEINELSNIFYNSRPDFVLAIADRFETISVAITAAFMNIPLIHTQGGEITGSIDESVRHSVSKFANIHFPANYYAKKNLIRMGEKPNSIYNVGCPSIDLAKSIENKKINLSKFFKKYKALSKKEVNNKNFKDYIIVVQHPVTTEYDKTKSQISKIIKIINKLNYNTIWLWPNIDSGSDIIAKQIRIFRERNNLKNVVFLKNCAPEDFLILLNNSRCIVGNSSVGIREASYLGVPCVNIGSRQSGRKKGKNVINVKYNEGEIAKAVKKQFKKKKYKKIFLYGNGYAGRRMVKIISNLQITSTQKRLNYK